MKVLGILMILLTGIWVGEMRIEQHHKRIKTIELMIMLFKNLEGMISYLQIPIIDALQNIAKQTAFQDFLFLKIINLEIQNKKAVNEAWNIALEELYSKKLLSNSQFDLLSNFIYSFGKTDTQGQKKHIEYYIRRLEVNQELLLKDSKNKDKLLFSLSFFISVLLCILLF